MRDDDRCHLRDGMSRRSFGTLLFRSSCVLLSSTLLKILPGIACSTAVQLCNDITEIGCDAGSARQRAQQSGAAMGVYVGVGSADYEALSRQVGVPLSAFSFTAASASVASGRISYAFGFRGPTASIDTACSASLVAAHMACGDFRSAFLPSSCSLFRLKCAERP